MFLPPTRVALILGVVIYSATALAAQTATFTGRVTEQANGQGISGAAVVAEGNVTGTRVVVTDAQGNYNLTIGANTNIRVRPYKTTYVFNPLMVAHVSSGPAISGSFSHDFAGSSIPFRIITLPPVMLTEDNSLSALTLDGVVHTRDPFAVTNDHYFGSDKRTRLTLLLVDLDLYPNQGESLSLISVQAQTQSSSFNLVPEDLRKVPGFPWMSQLVVRLPPELSGSGEANITVTFSGQFQTSRSAKVRFQ
ncbi:MAG TPA: hypothetical protein VFX97_18770 [Pyrinomonadaceae bacterium]|nr:hypothetical protein [Pyrinomonadaceae bacterium]